MPALRVRVGEATVSVLNLGDLVFKLKDVERSPESEWRPRYGELFETPLRFPSQSFHIATADASVVVDAGDYSLFASADPSYAPRDYTPPPPLAAQLAEMGVGTDEVTHLVITHAHYDHFAGVTRRVDGRPVPAFPKAKCLLGKADWEDQEMQKALADPGTPEALTLGVVSAFGLLEPVDGERRITASVTTVPSPGESPGHRTVRVSSGGETAYLVGDLFHHAVEVEDVRLMARWCDALANIASRRELIRAALSEGALVMAAHMPPGRLHGTADAPRFTPL